eukprot:4913616-Amphidinium_carterae.1
MDMSKGKLYCCLLVLLTCTASKIPNDGNETEHLAKAIVTWPYKHTNSKRSIRIFCVATSNHGE